jgi:D-alanyl-D-alanine carboxypeptidase
VNTWSEESLADIIYGAAILYDAKDKKETTEVKDVQGEVVKPTESKGNTATKKPNDCPKPKKDYADESYMDVGQDVALEDKSYIPDNLVELERSISKYDNLCVKEEARDALAIMIAEAKKEKLNIIVSSGFRDFNTQKDILNTNIASGNKNATKLVAKPGYSEHQLGLAVDFTSPSIGNVSAAAKFGEIIMANSSSAKLKKCSGNRFRQESKSSPVYQIIMLCFGKEF